MPAKTLHIDLKAGDSISIDGGRVIISLVHKSGRLARLSFTAAQDVPIDPVRQRAEVESEDNVIAIAR